MFVGGDRDDNGGGGEPLRWVRLEETSSEDRNFDGILDRLRECRPKLVRVLGEIGCGELVDGKLHIIWGWAGSPERVVPDREGLVELEGHSLIVGSIGGSGGVDIVGC